MKPLLRWMHQYVANRNVFRDCLIISIIVVSDRPWCEVVCRWWWWCRQLSTTWRWAPAGPRRSSWSGWSGRRRSALDAVEHWTEATSSSTVYDVGATPSTSSSALIQGRPPETLGRNSSWLRSATRSLLLPSTNINPFEFTASYSCHPSLTHLT